jgi:hypothetical protein
MGELVRQPQWEVRQGGFLGLHALLAARDDLVGALLPTLVPLGVHGSVTPRYRASQVPSLSC